jgi:hypothetical protein
MLFIDINLLHRCFGQVGAIYIINTYNLHIIGTPQRLYQYFVIPNLLYMYKKIIMIFSSLVV